MSGRPVWPGGARCAAMLSFDVDGPAVWIDSDARVRESPTTFSLGGYGPDRAVPRILGLLRDYELKATFFVPGWVAEHWPRRFAAIADSGHELGHHGYLHEIYFTKSIAEQEELIERSQAIFERIAGRRAVGYRTPSGDFAAETPALLARLGFSYSSSMRGDDRPYHWDLDGGDLVEIPAHWELDDFPQWGYNDDPADPESQDRIAGLEWTLDNWRREFDGYHAEGLCFPLMLHPQVIGKPSRMQVLRELIEHMRARGDVWFATGAEIAAWWRETGQ